MKGGLDDELMGYLLPGRHLDSSFAIHYSLRYIYYTRRKLCVCVSPG